MILKRSILKTPIGDLLAVADNESLYMLDFADLKNIDKKLAKISKNKKNQEIKSGKNKIIDQIKEELKDYFAGNLRQFKTKVALTGTDFQNSVWQSLQDVNYGKTISYLDLAKNIGKEKSVRAIANAIGANPLPIILPCHRIVGSDGSLTGYSGGIDKKKFLLELES